MQWTLDAGRWLDGSASNNSNGIRKCEQGEYKQSRGYIWKYSDDTKIIMMEKSNVLQRPVIGFEGYVVHSNGNVSSKLYPKRFLKLYISSGYNIKNLRWI